MTCVGTDAESDLSPCVSALLSHAAAAHSKEEAEQALIYSLYFNTVRFTLYLHPVSIICYNTRYELLLYSQSIQMGMCSIFLFRVFRSVVSAFLAATVTCTFVVLLGQSLDTVHLCNRYANNVTLLFERLYNNSNNYYNNSSTSRARVPHFLQPFL